MLFCFGFLAFLSTCEFYFFRCKMWSAFCKSATSVLWHLKVHTRVLIYTIFHYSYKKSFDILYMIVVYMLTYIFLFVNSKSALYCKQNNLYKVVNYLAIFFFSFFFFFSYFINITNNHIQSNYTYMLDKFLRYNFIITMCFHFVILFSSDDL